MQKGRRITSEAQQTRGNDILCILQNIIRVVLSVNRVLSMIVAKASTYAKNVDM